MIFQKLLLENIFSYRHAEFDFTGATADRNIVLIFGRNGYGKTSFINAVKLLFAGPNEEMRYSILPGVRPSPDKYVLGFGDEWMGIFNARAKREGHKFCRVKLTWQENDSEVEVERRWDLAGTSYTELVTVDVRGDQARHLEKEEAQQFLNERLPEEYLPFFFFDAEQIQRLANANRIQTTREIERLLKLTHVDTLAEYLDKIGREWRKQDMPHAVLALLKRYESEKAELEAKIAAKYEEIETLQSEQDELERLVQQEDVYLESRRTGKLTNEEGPLKAELVRCNEDLEQLQLRIVEKLPRNAFLIANAPLAERALAELNKIINNPAGAQVEVLKAILDDLPRDLFKAPSPIPSLSENQIRFYRDRLQHLLQAYIPDPSAANDGLMKLDPGPAQQLRAVLEYALQSAHEREDRATQLKEAVRLKAKIREIEDKLHDISSLPTDEQQEYAERKELNDGRRVRIGTIISQRDVLEGEIRDLGKKTETKESEIRAQEKKVNLSEKNRKRLDRAEALKHFFQGYKDELKRRKRAAVEEAVNKRFKELMTSHDFISHIRVDDLFGVHYLDAQGESIGMANIAAGMKQLAATALLWALKEIADKEVPLIIDTPLARIDRGNQENLLTRYYPHVGSQVIILPTDSEIDREKHAVIAPHVYREYQLENAAGQDTSAIHLSAAGGRE